MFLTEKDARVSRNLTDRISGGSRPSLHPVTVQRDRRSVVGLVGRLWLVFIAEDRDHLVMQPHVLG